MENNSMENDFSAQLPKKAGPEKYDLVVLGSGAGSKLIAWRLAEQGQRVAVIERKYIGGSCPNIACLPSKNIVHSAKVASYFGRGKEFGIVTKGFAVDMSAVRDRKRRMVSGEIDAHLDNYKRSGAELIIGSGRFIGPKTLEATLPDGTTRQLRGTNVIIGTGTRAAVSRRRMLSIRPSIRPSAVGSLTVTTCWLDSCRHKVSCIRRSPIDWCLGEPFPRTCPQPRTAFVAEYARLR
jgi:hypothetical protein